MLERRNLLHLFQSSHNREEPEILLGFSAVGCNATSDEQCYGGLGIILGSLCSDQNNVSTSPSVTLLKITSSQPYALTPNVDQEGNIQVDTVEFENFNAVNGTKYTLTSGDIIKNAGKVSLDLINSGSIDGQKIFNSDEIEVSTQGTTVLLVSNWYNNKMVSILDSDQSVTLNNLQASTLDSAKASDGFYYPGTNYSLKDINAPSGTILLTFNEQAILGTSTEVEIALENVNTAISGTVFVDPNPAEEAAAPADPFAVVADSDIEKLTLKLSDQDTNSILKSLDFTGLSSLDVLGGATGGIFEISNPLGANLKQINAEDVKSNVILNSSLSVLPKSFKLGPGDDILNLGNSLIASPQSDIVAGGLGIDTLRISFTGEITTNPTISSFEKFEVSFNGATTLNLSNVSDLTEMNILSSTAAVSIDEIPFDITKFVISGTQAGDWKIKYEENASAATDLRWSNNTEGDVAVTSVTFDEMKNLAITSDGPNNIIIGGLAVDPDDTTAISLTNTDDGDLIISAGANLVAADAVTAISLTSTEGGAVKLGSVSGSFGVPNAPKLSSVILNASETGNMELGNIGSTIACEDLQNVSLSSSGGNISLGSITAANVDNFTASVSSSAVISLGSLNFSNQGSAFNINGSGSLGPLNFSKEAFSTINFTDMTTATTTSFPNATKPVTVFGGAGEDNFVVGKGSDSITGGSGADVFTIANGSTGITPATADIITDFKTGVDKLKLGLVGDATSNTGNYSENVNSVADFQAALEAANTVLASLNSTSSASELYSFQFDSSYGYLFIDTDSDGVYEDLLLLSGIESSMIASSDIIA